MADIESNINLNIDTSDALASLRSLQRQISTFQQTMSKTGAVSSAQLGNMQQNLINGINATGQFSATMQRVTTTTESFTNSLEKNKFSMGQYFKYAGAATSTFGKLFRGEFDTIEKVARERVKTLQTQYIKLGRDASGAMQSISVRPLTLDMNDLGTKTAIASQKAQLFNQLMKQGSTELLNFGKNTQWAGRQLMVGFTIPLGIMGAAAAKEFKAIEEQVIRLERVYGDFTTTMSDTNAMTDSIKKLAGEFTKYGVAVSKTIGMAADAAAMGKTGADLVAQVAEANRLAVLGGVDQQKSLETTISLTNSFGIAADQLAGKINFLNAVENQTVTSIDDLTEAIPKAGPVVQQLGGNVEDLTFFLTAMKEGGINASEGANALKSGLASLINPTGEAATMLEGFGINIQNIVNSNKGDVKGIVTDFAKALDTLDPLNRAQAIEQLFGKFQFARMSTLFQNVIAEGSQANRVLELTKASSDQLAAMSKRELSKIEESPLYKFEGAIEKFKASLAPVGEEFMKAVTPIINFGTDILNKFNEMSDGGKQFAIIVTGAVAAIGPVALMTFGLLANGVANLIKGFMFVRNVFTGTGRSTNVLAEQTQYMTSEQLQAAAVATSLGQVHTNLIQTFNAEAGAVRNLASAYGAGIAAQSAFMGPIVSGRGRTPKKMATGGMVPGSGNGDTVPAMLTPGEFVLTKDVAAKYPGLIAGMMAGKVGMFASGGWVGMEDLNAEDYLDPKNRAGTRKRIQKSHLQGAMDLNDPAAMAAVRAKFPNIDSMSPELMGRTAFSGSLTADLPGKMNQWLRDSSKQKMSPQVFEQMWNSVADKLTSTAVSAGVDMTNESHKKALQKIEKEIGREASILASANGKGYVDDTTLAAATKTVLDKNINSKNKASSKVAAGLRSRETVLGDVRGNIGSAELRAMEQSGQLIRRGTQLVDPATGISYGEVRQSGSSAGRHKGFKANQIGGYTKQEVMGGTLADPKSIAAAKKAGKKAAEAQTKAYVDGLVEAADTASPSKRTKKVAKDTVDGYVVGLEEGKAKTKAAGKTVVPSIMNSAGAQNLRDKFPKIIGKVPNLAEAQAAAYGGMNIMKGKELQFARGSRLLSAAQGIKPANILNDTVAKLGQTFTTVGVAAKNLAVEAGNKTVQAVKNFGTAVKELPGKLQAAAAQMKTSLSTFINGTPDVDGQPGKPGAKTRIVNAVSGGKAGMIGMAASSALMMGGAAMGGDNGAIMANIGSVVMGLSSVLTIFEMFPGLLSAMLGPWGLVVAALAGIAIVAIDLKNSLDGARQSAAEAAAAIGINATAMKGLAEAAGTVSPTEIMNARRSAAAEGVKKPADTSFGAQYLETEAGKKMATGLEKGIKAFGQGAALDELATQLSTAVASGIMTPEQAKSVAVGLGAQLKDVSITGKLDAKITQLIGLNGEDLSKDPMSVNVRLITSAKDSLTGPNGPLAELQNTGFVGWFDKEGWAKVAAAEELATSKFNGMVSQNQLLLDNLQLQHEARLKNLQAEGDIKGIADENAKYEANRTTQMQTNAANMKAAIDQINTMQGTWDAENSKWTGKNAANVEAMVNRTKAATATQFKGTENAGAVENIGKGMDTAYGLQASAKMTFYADIQAGTMDPKTLEGLMKVVNTSGNAETYQIIANVSAKLGGEAANALTSILPAMGKEMAVDFVANINLSDPAKAKEALGTINTLKSIKEQLGEEGYTLAIKTLVDDKGNPTQKLKNLQGSYAKIKGLIDAGGPIKLETITEIDWAGVKDLGAVQSWFDGIDKVQQKFFLDHLVTVYATITDDELDAYLKKTGEAPAKKGMNIMGWQVTPDEYTPEQRNKARAAAAVESTKAITEALAASNAFASQGPPSGNRTPDPTPTPTGSGAGSAPAEAEKPPASFLDDIVKQVRQVNLGAATITENFADSWAAINGFFGSGAPVNVFAGLEQQMRRIGASEDLISLITGMSKEEWEAQKNNLFNFDSSGNISSLKDMASAIGRAISSIKLGEFQSQQQKSIKSSADQAAAINKLVAAGASYARAYEMVQDAAFAAAVAQETNIEKIKELVMLAQQAAAALNLMSAAQSVVQGNQEASDMRNTIGFLENYSEALSDAQTEAILKSKELQTMLKNFDTLTVDQLKSLDEALKNADLQAQIELKTKMLTPEGMQQVFQDGFGKAMDAFSAQEQEIKLKFKVLRNPLEELVKGFQDQISDIKNAPGGLDDLEADLQRIGEKEIDINKKYEDRFKALDEIQKANDRIAAQQRTQLSLADALSQGDIGAAARAAQEIRATETAQALVDQREALKKSQELEISQLQGEMGMTREQLEARIRNIKAQIFEIEEKSIEPAQYQLELLKRREEAETAALTVLGKTKDEWEKIKNSTDIARVASEQYKEAMNTTLGVADDLIAKWAEITAPKETLHTIIEKKVATIEEADRLRREQEARDAAARAAQQAQASTATPAAPAGLSDAQIHDYAKRVIRGEFGNGQARRNALAAIGVDYQTIQDRVNRILYQGYATGGLVASYMAKGGLQGLPKMGTDTVPAMLTPGEFVVKKYAVENFGVENLKAINDGTYKSGSVYNNTYSISVSAQSNANADDIAKTVIAQIKQVDAQRIRGNRF